MSQILAEKSQVVATTTSEGSDNNYYVDNFKLSPQYIKLTLSILLSSTNFLNLIKGANFKELIKKLESSDEKKFLTFIQDFVSSTPAANDAHLNSMLTIYTKMFEESLSCFDTFFFRKRKYKIDKFYFIEFILKKISNLHENKQTCNESRFSNDEIAINSGIDLASKLWSSMKYKLPYNFVGSTIYSCFQCNIHRVMNKICSTYSMSSETKKYKSFEDLLNNDNKGIENMDCECCQRNDFMISYSTIYKPPELLIITITGDGLQMPIPEIVNLTFQVNRKAKYRVMGVYVKHKNEEYERAYKNTGMKDNFLRINFDYRETVGLGFLHKTGNIVCVVLDLISESRKAFVDDILKTYLLGEIQKHVKQFKENYDKHHIKLHDTANLNIPILENAIILLYGVPLIRKFFSKAENQALTQNEDDNNSFFKIISTILKQMFNASNSVEVFHKKFDDVLEFIKNKKLENAFIDFVKEINFENEIIFAHFNDCDLYEKNDLDDQRIWRQKSSILQLVIKELIQINSLKRIDKIRSFHSNGLNFNDLLENIKDAYSLWKDYFDDATELEKGFSFATMNITHCKNCGNTRYFSRIKNTFNVRYEPTKCLLLSDMLKNHYDNSDPELCLNCSNVLNVKIINRFLTVPQVLVVTLEKIEDGIDIIVNKKLTLICKEFDKIYRLHCLEVKNYDGNRIAFIRDDKNQYKNYLTQEEFDLDSVLKLGTPLIAIYQEMQNCEGMGILNPERIIGSTQKNNFNFVNSAVHLLMGIKHLTYYIIKVIDNINYESSDNDYANVVEFMTYCNLIKQFYADGVSNNERCKIFNDNVNKMKELLQTCKDEFFNYINNKDNNIKCVDDMTFGYLKFFIDKIMKEPKIDYLYKSLANDANELAKKYEDKINYFETNSGFIEKLFGLHVNYEIRCKNCNRNSNAFQTLHYVNVVETVNQGFGDIFIPEFENSFECRSCQSLDFDIIKKEFYSLPHILIIKFIKPTNKPIPKRFKIPSTRYNKNHTYKIVAYTTREPEVIPYFFDDNLINWITLHKEPDANIDLLNSFNYSQSYTNITEGKDLFLNFDGPKIDVRSTDNKELNTLNNNIEYLKIPNVEVLILQETHQKNNYDEKEDDDHHHNFSLGEPMPKKPAFINDNYSLPNIDISESDESVIILDNKINNENKEKDDDEDENENKLTIKLPNEVIKKARKFKKGNIKKNSNYKFNINIKKKCSEKHINE